MNGTFRALCVLFAALIQYSLWISASPVIHRKLELPNGFVAGPPLTREEFDTPITSLTRDGIVDPAKAPTCTILVPDWYGKNAITSSSLMWPNSRIPYVISESFNTAERQIIATAMNEYEKNTCITFVPRIEEVDYIVITAGGSGCTSYVGRVGGAQTVSLDPGCVYTYIVIHELMHAAGFWHEQSRTDRDDYVDINWDNIQPGYEYAFDKYSSAYIQLLGTLYDYGSVMHYDAYAFAIDRTIPTITAKDGSKLGNTVGFSANDLFKVNRLHNCDPNDTCWDDEVLNCPSLVDSGLCTRDPQQMIVRCRKSCGFCNQPVCQDDNAYCGYWADNGECVKSAAYMQLYCKRACRFCDYDPSIAP